MNLGKDVSEDTSAGRLILNNCTTVLITAANTPSKQESGMSNETWLLELFTRDWEVECLRSVLK